MKSASLGIGWVVVLCMTVAGISGIFGFRVGNRTAELAAASAAEERLAPAEVVSAPEPDPLADSGPSNAEIDAMLAEMADEAAPPQRPQPFGPGGGNQRWDNMPMEQRRLLRKSMFAALAKVDGLEEVGDAIREGKIDPSKFNLNPEAIADRMEFYAGSMDEKAMEEEVTKTLQSVVDQAKSQLK